MEQTQAALMAYGLDSASVEKILKTYTLPQLKKLSLRSLLSLGLTEEIAKRLQHPTRTPIPQKNVEEILVRSAFTCCVCHQPGLPVVIHHLDSWEHSHSHEIDNLAVLCLNHHGEAHSHHENSRNLTARVIKAARDQWYATVQRQTVETELALETVKRYNGRWDYFNLSYIYGFIDEHNIHFNSRYKADLIAKGLLTSEGTICADKLTKNSTHWLDFFNGQYLKRYIEEMVNVIIGRVPIRYIKDSLYIPEHVRPGELLLVDGRFYFKKLNKRTKGIGQTRRVRGTVNHMIFTGEFDAWYCNSTSSHGMHLTGNKYATQLCLVRDVKHVEGSDLIDCTIIGLGLNLTQPDVMAQLMGNAMDISDFRPKDVCEQELDSLADLQRGEDKGQYYISPPDVCDICKTSFCNQKYMIDGAMKPSGIGACMCPQCYHLHGAGIGWGVGQLYLNKNGRWLLVGGFCEYEEDEIDEYLALQLIEALFPPMHEE